MEQYFDETETGNSFNGDDGAWKSTAKSVNKPERSFSGGFDCNICLDSVQDPVVTLCGHLYCWPCIYKWIHHQNTSSSDQTLEKKTPQCPVCKTEVAPKTMVPLYGRGQQAINPGTEEKSPGLEELAIPRRPPAPRYGVLDAEAGSQLSRRRFHQRAPPPLAMPVPDLTTMVMSPSPTINMLGEMVSGRILGDLETPLFASPNSYNLAGLSTRRARREATQADRSLSRIYTFLFCCIIFCLLLFT